MAKDTFRSPLKPIDLPRPKSSPTPAPPWVALLTAWLGLVMLIASIVFLLLPGSRHFTEEVNHLRPYSAADRFLPFPIYGISVTLFLGIVVLWQMRRVARPLPDALLAQRLQAWTGIALALLAALVIYAIVIHGYLALHRKH